MPRPFFARISLVSAIAIGLAVSASCSLDLDEALIDAPRDGGNNNPDGTLPDGAPLDGGTDTGSVPASPDAAACTNDDACKTTDGCLKGKCDLSRKTCAYELCRTACNGGTCDLQKRTCTPAAAAYKFKAAQFPIGQPLLCGRCAAAIHPWLFIATPTGVVAFNVSNPGNGTPPPVPIIGLGFVPNQLVHSGSRVWMIGPPSGPGGANGRIPVAFIDPPLDPFATQITAKNLLMEYTRPAPEGVSLFARGGDTALLVGPQQPSQYASGILEPGLLTEPAKITAHGIPGFAPNTSPFAMSGKRLLMQGLMNGIASFNLIDNAGTPNPAVGPVVNMTDLGNTASGSRTVAQSADGAIFLGIGANKDVTGPPPPPPTTRAARGYFLVANDTGAIETNVGVDIEIYDADIIGANTQVIGPIAMLDANTAMIATAARENPVQQTAVQFVKRNPLGTLKEPNGTTPRRQLLTVPIDKFAAATSSDGIGYLVANDIEGPPAAGTVYVFDPGCAP